MLAKHEVHNSNREYYLFKNQYQQSSSFRSVKKLQLCESFLVEIRVKLELWSLKGQK